MKVVELGTEYLLTIHHYPEEKEFNTCWKLWKRAGITHTFESVRSSEQSTKEVE